MNPRRVLVVDDSAVVRELLLDVIGRDPRLSVIGTAGTGEEALRLVHKLSPDVISMDIRLPGLNGFETTQRIMAEKPTPVVVVSASIEAPELAITMNALRAGALSVVEKPPGRKHPRFDELSSQMCTQLAIMSEVQVVTQRRPRVLSVRSPRAPRGPYSLVGLVTSTGGPSALTRILGALDADYPMPVVLVQHIGSTFLDGFVNWLALQTRMRVRTIQDVETARAGHLYLPPADRHVRVDGSTLRLTAEPLCCGQRPSGTILFESMADSLGTKGVGVLLTGMGADGAEGMQRLCQAGGWTIAEDPSTAVVYGMPGEAVRLGAVCESLPLGEVGGRLLELAR
ncbi:MAG TPA: chemotaxis protein CheB [Candidatus Xenobia bacterium]